MRRLLLPLMGVYLVMALNRLFSSTPSQFWYSGCAFMALLIAYNSLNKRKYYWLIPLVVAVFPSAIILSGIQKYPIVGGYWSIASIFFYFATIHYRFAWVPLLLLLPIYTFVIYGDLGGYAASRYVFSYGLVVYFLFLFTREIVQAYKEARYLSENDHLTGLASRRSLMNAVQKWFDFYQRSESGQITMALIDLDYFKKLNDKYGHQAGDAALKEFGNALTSSIRKTDIAGRYGGEEFLVLFPDTDTQGAMQVMQSLRAKLMVKKEGDLPQISFSSGIATLASDSDYRDWINRADKALYQAKHQGRAKDIVAKLTPEKNYS